MTMLNSGWLIALRNRIFCHNGKICEQRSCPRTGVEPGHLGSNSWISHADKSSAAKPIRKSSIVDLIWRISDNRKKHEQYDRRLIQ
jgi:hypothetical protein